MKTPIEKAAEEIWETIVYKDDGMTVSQMVAIMQRRLKNAVPKLKYQELAEGDSIITMIGKVQMQIEVSAYNQCRRDIGLEDL